MSAMVLHELTAAAASPDGWRAMTLPDSSPDVSLLRLHVDRGSRATVSLVRFPPGWSRPGTGHYDVAEEFYLLSGDLTVSRTRYAPGDWAWLPARATRSASGSRSGALALALFSGVPTWSPGVADGHVPAGRVSHLAAMESSARPLRTSDPCPGSVALVPAVVPAYDDAVDILWPALLRWAYVPAGEPVPDLPGPAVVRRWPAPSS